MSNIFYQSETADQSDESIMDLQHLMSQSADFPSNNTEFYDQNDAFTRSDSFGPRSILNSNKSLLSQSPMQAQSTLLSETFTSPQYHSQVLPSPLAADRHLNTNMFDGSSFSPDLSETQFARSSSLPIYPHDTQQSNFYKPLFPNHQQTQQFQYMSNDSAKYLPSDYNSKFLQSRRSKLGSENSKPFTCSHPGCDRSFARVQNLRSHSRCHLTTAPHACPTCGHGFKRTTDLQRHIRTMHTPNDMKPWPCTKCGKRFGRSDALKRHMTSRSKEHGCPAGPNLQLLEQMETAKMERQRKLDIDYNRGYDMLTSTIM